MHRALIFVLLGVFCLCKSDPQSPLMYNTAFFLDRMTSKLDVNVMFHYYHVKHEKGVCSSKAGPYCKFINPHDDFTMKVPLDTEMKKIRDMLYLNMPNILGTFKSEIFTKENPDTILLASPELIKLDAYIQKIL